MNRRTFLTRLAAVVAVAPIAPQMVQAVSPAPMAPSFPPLNFIDFPEPITAMQPLEDRLYVFTERGVYALEGTGGQYVSHDVRFRAEYIDNHTARVTKLLNR